MVLIAMAMIFVIACNVYTASASDESEMTAPTITISGTTIIVIAPDIYDDYDMEFALFPRGGMDEEPIIDWQESNRLANEKIESGATFVVAMRVADDNSRFVTITIRMPPLQPSIYRVGRHYIQVRVPSGYENILEWRLLRNDGRTEREWSTEPRFDDLEANTSFSVQARFRATKTDIASLPSAGRGAMTSGGSQTLEEPPPSRCGNGCGISSILTFGLIGLGLLSLSIVMFKR